MEQVETGHAQRHAGGSRENRRGNNRVRYTEKVFVPKNRNQNHQASSTSDPFASNASSSSFDNPLDHVPLPPPHVIDPSIRVELQTGNSQQASRRNETGRAHPRGPRRGGHAQQERAVEDAGASHDFGEAPRRGRRDGQRNQRNRGRRDSPSHVEDEAQPAHERDAIGSGDAGASGGPVPRGDARGGERRTEAPRRNGGNDRQDRSQRGERRTDRGQQRGGRRDKRDQPRHHDSYAHAHARVAPATAAHGEMTDLAEELLTGLLNDSYECMICMNNIRRRQSLWHCEECYALFHLDCISKWSKNSLEEARQVPQGILPQKPPADGWRCPHCNKTHREREGPPVSRCFCGKYTNPEFNPYITPHSCGDLCGRMRAGTDCPHPCNLPCHPGPCPPCSATGPVKYCWCGNDEYRTRCGETDPGRSCGELCDRPLNCRKHRCEEPCHPGSCQKCTKQLPMKCYCGKVEEERTCGTEVEDKASGETRHFSCGAVCGQQLACGNHTCQRVCHTGPCDECALLPKNVKKCACGKTDILFLAAPRTSCLDPIPTCTKKCEKKLHCGVHSCAKNCHVGDCPPCKGTVDMPCRCKLNTKRIPCLQAFPLKTMDSNDGDKAPVVVLCDVACSITRSCGRHRCNTKCCTSAGDPLADEHICKIPCNKPLKCGKHRCGRLCHKGRCPPCLEASFDELACHCGKTVMAPPIPCSTLPPECNHPCVRPSPCGHALPYHACHRDNEPCPPCTVLVEKWCMGNHELRSHVPCHVKDVSCGSPCGKPMPCGQHKCARICHRAPCVVPKEPETAATSSAKNKTKKGKKEKEKDEPAWEETDEKQSAAEPELISCGQKCGRPLKHCAHNCMAPCHPGQPCPVAQCRQMVRITCPCKRRSMEVLCLRGGPAAEDEPGKEKEEEDFDPSQREDKRQLSCDEMCEREKRNQRIDEAFNMTGTKEKEAPVFTEELLAAARGNTVKFVQKVEEEFKKLILSPSGIRHSFPPMKVLQRALIHELARWYRLDAISYDPEPLRNVVVMKKGDSRIPPYALLSTLMASGRLPKVATTAPALGSAFDMDIGDATDCVLQIYNLSPIITTEHLATFLSRFSGEYVLKWLDDANALAIFSNVQQYQAALSSLQTDGTFKIRPYEGPKTSWLRSRTMVKGESASSSSTSSSSSSSATVATKPAKKPTTDAAAAKPGLPAPASFAAPNAFAVLLSSPAVDGVTPGDVSKDDSAAAPVDWEELADDGATSTDHAPPPVASTTTPTTTVSTQASTPNVWNAVVTSHVEPEKAPTAESRGEHTAATSAQWPCAHCTFLNPPSASRCEVCENTRF